MLNFGTKKITLLYQDFAISVFSITRVHCIIQWNLVIKRSDIIKPSYNKVILLVPAIIFLCFLP